MSSLADAFRHVPDHRSRKSRRHPQGVLFALIVPYGWAAKPGEWPEHGRELAARVAHTARRAGCAVVGVDVVETLTHGPWTGRTYGGQSIVCDRAGKPLATLADRAAEVRLVVVEPARA